MSSVQMNAFENAKRITEDTVFDFDCKGCGQCCFNMKGEHAIILYPYDIYNLAKGLKMPAIEVVQRFTEVSIGSMSGIPVLTLANNQIDNETEVCSFLAMKGDRIVCSVHDFKPGICRMYPLGRIFEQGKGTAQYIFQDYVECPGSENPKPQTLKKWFPNREENEKASAEFSAFMLKLHDRFNLTAIRDAENVGDPRMKDAFYDLCIKSLYAGYDVNKPFAPQFEKAATDYVKICEVFGMIFEQYVQGVFTDPSEIDTLDEEHLQINMLMLMSKYMQ